ncbi:Uncharacterised protein [Vibrio cholerae]|nr:Uncharacterised protein [Vibrio cholerae]CSD24011.1 Uncharacterised protein [Vibrio cholerae]
MGLSLVTSLRASRSTCATYEVKSSWFALHPTNTSKLISHNPSGLFFIIHLLLKLVGVGSDSKVQRATLLADTLPVHIVEVDDAR